MPYKRKSDVNKNNPFYGKKHTEETIEKIRKAKLGKKLTEETKQKLRGRKRSEEFRRNLSEQRRGKKHSEETLQKFRERKHTEETIEKMRKSMLGKNSGKKHTDETKQKMSEQRCGTRLKELNPSWKGDKVKIGPSLHQWVRKHLSKPDLCEVCNIKPPLDLANVTGIYSRAFENWRYMCRRCHILSDGRMNNLKQYRKTNYKGKVT